MVPDAERGIGLARAAPGLLPGEAARAHRLVRGLATGYGAACLAAAAPLLSLRGGATPWPGRVRDLAQATLADGTLALCLGPALLCLAVLCATAAMTRARLRAARLATPPAGAAFPGASGRMAPPHACVDRAGWADGSLRRC